MKNIQVRQVTRKDAPFLQQLMNDTQIMADLNELSTPVEVWEDAILEWDNDPDEEDYIILHEGTPAGWLGINGLASESKQVWVKVIALLPTHQGRGIGHHVMSGIIEDLALRGFRSVALYTDRSNERAQRCYKKCGLEVSEETVQKMPNGITVERYKMERTIGTAAGAFHQSLSAQGVGFCHGVCNRQSQPKDAVTSANRLTPPAGTTTPTT